MRQVKRRSYWRCSDNFLGKNKMIKRGKCLGKPRMTYIHRWFSGRKPEVTGSKLTFSVSRRHDWTQQPIEKSVGMQKVVIFSHQSLKKMTFYSSKNPSRTNPTICIWRRPTPFKVIFKTTKSVKNTFLLLHVGFLPCEVGSYCTFPKKRWYILLMSTKQCSTFYILSRENIVWNQ